jgi:Xaa-Pro aminopeptidase
LKAQVYAVLPREKWTDSALVLPTSEGSDILCNELSWIDDLRGYGNFYIETPTEVSLSDWEKKLSNLIKSAKPSEGVDALVNTLKDKALLRSRIGLDEAGLTPPLFERIKEKLPDAKIVKAYDIFREIRMVKTDEERRRLRRAVNITEKAIKSVLSIAREGMTIGQLVARLIATMVDEGAEPAYPAIGISTDNFVQNIPPPTKKKLRRGDLIRFDCGCMYKYYYSDIARMAVLGNPSEKQRRYYAAVVEGEQAALNMIRAGVRAADIFDAVVRTVREAGIPHYKRHHVGHGIGIELYDPPLLAPSTETFLEEGMVVNIEPPYYEIRFGGVQIEDCVVITKTGYEMFNESSREMYKI